MQARTLMVLFVLLVVISGACSPGVSPTVTGFAPEPGQPTQVVVRILNLDAVLQQKTAAPQATLAPTATQVFIPTQTPVPLESGAQASPENPTPACTNRAEFIKHLTISDNTAIEAGQSFTKVWQLKNIGTCSWTTGYSFRFFSGEAMTSVTEVYLPAEVQSAEMVDIRLDLVAPLTMSSYVGNWVLSNERGEIFGVGDDGNQPVAVIINVRPTPKPSPG